MIRLSHTNLEAVRQEPSAFARLGSRQFSGPSRLMYVKWATKKYHEGGLQAAIDYVEQGFLSRGFRMEFFDKYAAYLIDYERAFLKRGGTALEFNQRMEVRASRGVFLTGEISRIDLDADSYSAWLFSEELAVDWRDELRMPLIQGYVAELMGAPLSEVSVGFYAFSAAAYDSERYSEAALRRTTRELHDIASRLPSP